MGEAALLVQAQPDPTLDPAELAANRMVLALADLLDALALPGIEAVVPAISSVLIRYDPVQLTPARLHADLRRIVARLAPVPATPARVVTVAVRYGGVFGPDLEEVAALLGITPAEVIRLHTAQIYRVLMIGFTPGFAYAGMLPPALHLPRRSTPRTAVPQGSVAIAAGLTGIYPAVLPGGWHLIGHAELELFEPQREPPCLLLPGDGLQFTLHPDAPVGLL